MDKWGDEMINRTHETAIQQIYNFIDMKECGTVYTNGKDFYKVVSDKITEVYHHIFHVGSDIPGGKKKEALSSDDLALLEQHVFDAGLRMYLIGLLEKSNLDITIALPEVPIEAYCDSIDFGGDFAKTNEYLSFYYRTKLKSINIPEAQESLGLRIDSNGELKYVLFGNSLEFQNEKSSLLKYNMLTIYKAETIANKITEKSGILFKVDPSNNVESIYICKQ